MARPACRRAEGSAASSEEAATSSDAILVIVSRMRSRFGASVLMLAPEDTMSSRVITESPDSDWESVGSVPAPDVMGAVIWSSRAGSSYSGNQDLLQLSRPVAMVLADEPL